MRFCTCGLRVLYQTTVECVKTYRVPSWTGARRDCFTMPIAFSQSFLGGYASPPDSQMGLLLAVRSDRHPSLT